MYGIRIGGIDLTGLSWGTEGTLGVFTELIKPIPLHEGRAAGRFPEIEAGEVRGGDDPAA